MTPSASSGILGASGRIKRETIRTIPLFFPIPVVWSDHDGPLQHSSPERRIMPVAAATALGTTTVGFYVRNHWIFRRDISLFFPWITNPFTQCRSNVISYAGHSRASCCLQSIGKLLARWLARSEPRRMGSRDGCRFLTTLFESCIWLSVAFRRCLGCLQQLENDCPRSCKQLCSE